MKRHSRLTDVNVDPVFEHDGIRKHRRRTEAGGLVRSVLEASGVFLWLIPPSAGDFGPSRCLFPQLITPGCFLTERQYCAAGAHSYS